MSDKDNMNTNLCVNCSAYMKNTSNARNSKMQSLGIFFPVPVAFSLSLWINRAGQRGEAPDPSRAILHLPCFVPQLRELCVFCLRPHSAGEVRAECCEPLQSVLVKELAPRGNSGS